MWTPTVASSRRSTADGGAYAYNVTRKLSELYLVEGLR
jgi:hypothetical protein